jgi:hypothetical protein
MSGVKITTDNASAVLSALLNLSKTEVLVGIPEQNANREDGEVLNNAEIAYLQSTGGDVELGGQKVTLTPRPFLDIGIEDTSDITSGFLADAASSAMDGDDSAASRALEKAGITAQNGAKRVIRDGDRLAPLSPATLADRRRDGIPGQKPLYAHGYLLRSINYVVRKK